MDRRRLVRLLGQEGGVVRDYYSLSNEIIFSITEHVIGPKTAGTHVLSQ